MVVPASEVNETGTREKDDFLIDKIEPDEIGEELVTVGELVADEEWQIINDSEHYLQEVHSIPEREIFLEQSEGKEGKHKLEDTGMDA